MKSFKIPFESAEKRIQELNECIQTFPDSPLAPIWEKEVKALREFLL